MCSLQRVRITHHHYGVTGAVPWDFSLIMEQTGISTRRTSGAALRQTRGGKVLQTESKGSSRLFITGDIASDASLQKGGVPAAPSGTATLLRLSPNHRFHPRPTLAVTDFRRPRLSWLDGRCVQGPGTYSPRHG